MFSVLLYGGWWVRLWVRRVMAMSDEKKLVLRGLRVLMQIGEIGVSWQVFMHLIGFLRWVRVNARGWDDRLAE